jgi:hypothetical protein
MCGGSNDALELVLDGNIGDIVVLKTYGSFVGYQG